MPTALESLPIALAPRSVVICIDDTPGSTKAFNWAIDEFINPQTDSVTLVNCRPFISAQHLFMSPLVDFDDTAEEIENEKQLSETLLGKFSVKLDERDILNSFQSVYGDDAGKELVTKIDELKADLVIVGSRGMGMLKRMAVGSVSDYLVHNCKCTVVVVK